MYILFEKWDKTPGDNLFEPMNECSIKMLFFFFHAHARYAQLKTGLNE
jgi:hypothetical protein